MTFKPCPTVKSGTTSTTFPCHFSSALTDGFVNKTTSIQSTCKVVRLRMIRTCNEWSSCWNELLIYSSFKSSLRLPDLLQKGKVNYANIRTKVYESHRMQRSSIL